MLEQTVGLHDPKTSLLGRESHCIQDPSRFKPILAMPGVYKYILLKIVKRLNLDLKKEWRVSATSVGLSVFVLKCLYLL